MFVFVSAFVAFGSWPGSESQTRVDQLVLRDLTGSKAQPKTVAVRADAVALAARAERKAAAGRKAAARTRTGAHTPGTAGAPAGTTPAGTQLAQAPGAAQTPAGAQPNATLPDPTQPLKQPAQNVATNINTTTENTTQQVETVTEQVTEVVDQAIGGPQAPVDPGAAVNNVTTGATDTVKDTTGSLLGH
jgi:hypothetical protein